MRRQEKFLDDARLFLCPGFSLNKTGVRTTEYKSYDDLPLMMSVQEVADVLGISKSSAYVLAKEKGFPTLKIGARVVIPRDRFIEWINKNVSK